MQARLLSECCSIPLHDGERLMAHIFSQKEAPASSLSIPSPLWLHWASCVTSAVLTFMDIWNWELDTDSYCAGQGEGATNREQEEKLNPPWRQGKSLPGIRSSTKLFWSNFWHADRPRQLFLDYKLRACSCLWTMWSKSFPEQGETLVYICPGVRASPWVATQSSWQHPICSHLSLACDKLFVNCVCEDIKKKTACLKIKYQLSFSGGKWISCHILIWNLFIIFTFVFR